MKHRASSGVDLAVAPKEQAHDYGVMAMSKKAGLIFAAACLLASTVPLGAAEYKHSGCAKAAKFEFPNDRAARKEFKHWCKDQWRIYKASHR